jgi:nucleotide-binding universal stress UspA family protein
MPGTDYQVKEVFAMTDIDTTISSILVPIDGSEPSVRALAYAGSLASRIGASVTGIYVIDPDKVSEQQPFNINFGAFDPNLEPSKKAASDYLDELKEHLPDNVPFSKEIAVGYPEKTIVRFADQKKIDLIVMGNSGKGAASSFITGSVSYYTIHHAKCPVLIVK